MTVVSLASERQEPLLDVEHSADSSRAGHVDVCILQFAVKGERRMASLREAEREELVVLLHVQTREHSARGGEQVDGGRRLGCGVEVPMPRDRRVPEPEVVRSDVDETGASEDRVRRRAVEALSALVELTEDVRIRHRVVERDGRAVQIGDGRERPGLARHGDHARGDRRSRSRLTREHRVNRAVRHLVAVEAVVERDGDVRGKLIEVLVEGDPLVEIGSHGIRRRVRRDPFVADQSPAIALPARGVTIRAYRWPCEASGCGSATGDEKLWPKSEQPVQSCYTVSFSLRSPSACL